MDQRLAQDRTKSKGLLDALYVVPDPLADYESWERSTHRDLQRLTEAELLREQERVRLRLVMDDKPDTWLLERLAALQAVLNAS